MESGAALVRRPLWRRLAASRGIQGIVLVLLFGWLFYSWIDTLGGTAAFRDRFGLTAIAILVPVQAVVAVSPFPSEVLVATNDSIFGFWQGAAMAWVGWMLAAFLQYELMRRTAEDFDFSGMQARMPNWLSRLPVDHPGFLILGRWLPAGSHIINSAAGALGVPLWRHAWCSAIAITPMALVVSGVGTLIAEWWSA